MSNSNLSPAERLEAALREYWPDLPMFRIDNGERWFCSYESGFYIQNEDGGMSGGPTIDDTLSAGMVQIIAAVAAAWFKAKRNAELRNNPEHIITTEWYRCNHAVATYQSIYESATEVA